MKVLSITVPCYNSQEYMRKCIESLLSGGDEVEILVVDDGSSDRTLEIAQEYEKNYPGLSVRSIRKIRGMAEQLTPVWLTPLDCILRWGTAMTG